MRSHLSPVMLLAAAFAGCSLLEPDQTCSGDYSYEEVATFFQQTTGLFGVPGVQSVDHDEDRGCIAVGVLAGADRSAVRARLQEVGVPLDAVVIRREAPLRLLHL